MEIGSQFSIVEVDALFRIGLTSASLQQAEKIPKRSNAEIQHWDEEP